MFMMHFMCPPYHFYVFVITTTKNLKTLMNNNIVHNKISETIHSYTGTNTHQPIGSVHTAIQNGKTTWYGKYQEEGIVLFKKARRFHMMILMQKPQPFVHDVFMSSPRYQFH